MKRPLFMAGFTMLFTLFLLLQSDSIPVAVGVSILSLLPFLILLFIKKKKDDLKIKNFSIILFCIMLSSVVFIFSQILVYFPSVQMAGDNKNIEAVVSEYPTESNNRIFIVAKVKPADSIKKVNIKLSLSKKTYNTIGEDIKPGDKVSFKGNIYKIGAGIKSVEQNYKSKGIYIGAYPTSDVNLIQSDKKTISTIISAKRQQIIQLFNEKFESPVSGVGIGSILGEKSYIETDVYNSFKTAGVAHILAISGLHLSIWILFFNAVFSFLGINKRKSSVVLILFVLFVMTLTGFSGSICRAGIMMISYLFGYAIGKKADGLNSLGLACIIVLIINPYACVNVGFLLSVFATFGIFVLANPIIEKLTKKILTRIKNRIARFLLNIIICSLTISISVTVFTLPIQIYYFGYGSILSPLTNLLFYPAVSPMIILFGIYAFFYYIPILNIVVAFLAKTICSYCIFVAEKVSAFPFAIVNVSKELIPAFIIFAIIVYIALFFILHFKNKNSIIAGISAIIIAFASFNIYNSAYFNNKAKVIVNNVSNGLVVTVEQNDSTALIYYGCEEYYQNYIYDNYQSFDYIINLSNKSFEVPDEIEYKSYIEDLNVERYEIGDCTLIISNEESLILAYNKVICITESINSDSIADVYITDNVDFNVENFNDSVIIYSVGAEINKKYSTTEQSDISIIISNNGKYRLKGENSWLSLMKKN